MQGQVFTVAKLHYINGVVYFVARQSSTDLTTLASHSAETTKSGSVKHPKVRVRTLVRFAQGLGLVERPSKDTVHITQLGRKYSDGRAKEKWCLSNRQTKLLRDHIQSDPSQSPTIHAITSLLSLVRDGYTGKALAHEYASAIGKTTAWQSEVTYKGFTNFGLDYLRELGFLKGNIVQEHVFTKQHQQANKTRVTRTFLFTWNPNRWKWDDLPQAVYEANAEGRYLNKWSCVTTRQIQIGDRVFLMRLGVSPKGIIGSGIVVSDPFEDPHWDPERAKQGDTVHQVDIVFDVLSDRPIITEQDLRIGGLAQHNWFPQSSGITIPEQIATLLERHWTQATGTSFDPPNLEDLPRLRTEGTERSRLVTTYERNPKARKECLRHHGSRCQVCGFLFEDYYGSIGEGFIHVHHIVPVSDIKQEYNVNPVTDLCPVCPNCHAMIHKRTPPYSIDEIKEMISTRN